jgi:hypothetical protein
VRWYKIITPGATWDATNDSSALNVELDLTVGALHAPANGNSSFVRVWGISRQTILSANKFNNLPITVFGGMQQGLPLANPRQQGLLVQGIIFPCLGNWVETDMTLDFFIRIGTAGAPNVPQAANVIHNWPAGQPLSNAIQQALKTAFPRFTPVINISSQLIRPNNEWGFYQTLGQYASHLFVVGHDIIKTPGYQSVQMSVQGNKIIVNDGSQQTTGSVQINPWDLVGQPVWTGTISIQFKTVLRGDISLFSQVTLPPTLSTLTSAAGTAVGVNNSNIIQGTFVVQSIRHTGNFRQPDWGSWCTTFDAIQANSSGGQIVPGGAASGNASP